MSIDACLYHRRAGGAGPGSSCLLIGEARRRSYKSGHILSFYLFSLPSLLLFSSKLSTSKSQCGVFFLRPFFVHSHGAVLCPNSFHQPSSKKKPPPQKKTKPPTSRFGSLLAIYRPLLFTRSGPNLPQEAPPGFCFARLYYLPVRQEHSVSGKLIPPVHTVFQ